MSLSSVELNYLIWRYLQESGNELAAYAFDKQSKCLSYEDNKSINVLSKIEPGFLVNLVQKGILYSLTEEDLRDTDKRSEILTFFGSLLKNEKEIHLASNLKLEVLPNDKNNMEIDKPPAFSTKLLTPTITYDDCLMSKFNPINDILAYVKNESVLYLITIHNNEISQTLALKTPGMNHISNNLTAIGWSPLGNIILTSSITGELCSWSSDGNLRNMTNGILKYDDTTNLGYIIEILWSPSGEYFLTIDSNRRICLWESVTLTFIQELISSNNVSAEWSACWLDKFKFALSVKSKSILIYQITPGVSNVYHIKTTAELAGHESVASSLVFNDESKYLASYCDSDGIIKLWTSSLISEPIMLNNQKPVLPVISMNFLHHGTKLLTTSIDGTVILWDIIQSCLVSKINIFKNDSLYKFEEGIQKGSLVYIALLSPNEQWLSIGDNMGNVSIWDVGENVCKGYYISIASSMCDMSWDKTSTMLSIAYNDKPSRILYWDLD